LKYHNQINGEDHYLTWKYTGTIFNKNTYGLILLSYKNEQNKFKIHLNDHLYLKKFYEKYELYTSNDDLDQIVFATCEYNTNDDEYLELIKDTNDEKAYIIRATIWSKNGPFSHLHVDYKNKLYFDKGINQNIAKWYIDD
jgi:hypothetical protein